LRTSQSIKTLAVISILTILLAFQGCNKSFLGFSFADREDIIVDKIDFEYMTTRTKFKFKDGDTKSKATARMRIKKDSIIWFSLTPGVGIEGARGIITQDSLILMDRVHKEVYAFSFDSLSRKFEFDFNFELFQAVLVGDLPFEREDTDVITDINNDIIIAHKEGPLTINNRIDMNTGRLKNLRARTSENENTLEIRYNEFKPLNEKAFANKALMILTYFKEGKKNQATVDLEHNRVRIEEKPLQFPFKIPSRYHRN